MGRSSKPDYIQGAGARDYRRAVGQLPLRIPFGATVVRRRSVDQAKERR